MGEGPQVGSSRAAENVEMNRLAPPRDGIVDFLRFSPGLLLENGFPSWANACVGNNGLNDLPKYTAGYTRAADLIIASVLDSQGNQVDALIYPACFCIRHAVELYLKKFTDQLLKLPATSRIPKANLEATSLSHDLGKMWGQLVRSSALIDPRMTPALGQLDGTIRWLAEIDLSGQVFRYPHSNEGDRHLETQRLINFVALDQAWRLLKCGLEAVDRLIQVITEEYSQGSFTANLSRLHLHQLSLMLPPKIDWASPDFNRVKQTAKQKFGVSNREFSNALNIIKKHREFASRIGIDIPLCGFDEDSWVWIAKAWTYQHTDHFTFGREKTTPNNTVAETQSRGLPYDIELSERRVKIRTEARDRLSGEFLATLHALFYFAFDPTYSENLDRIFLENLPLMKQKEQEGEAVMFQVFFDVFNKTNLIRNLARSLCVLGKIQWVVRLKSEITLIDCDEAIAWHMEREADGSRTADQTL